MCKLTTLVLTKEDLNFMPLKFTRFAGLVTLVIILLSNCFFLSGCGSQVASRKNEGPKSEQALAAEQQALAQGRQMWFDPNLGSNGRSCESCHPNGEITRAENYPRYKHVLRTMATLSMTHNFAVVNESKGQPWTLGSEPANALVLYVTFLANGKSIRMEGPKDYKDEWVKRGKAAFFDSGLGTNGMSCANCHVNTRAKNRTAEPQPIVPLAGVAATYPRYRPAMDRVVTLEQQINWCLEKKLNGSPLPLDDQTIVALSCYLTFLSEGKKIAVAKIK
jgi:thiosulfate dehydrogenase